MMITLHSWCGIHDNSSTWDTDGNLLDVGQACDLVQKLCCILAKQLMSLLNFEIVDEKIIALRTCNIDCD